MFPKPYSHELKCHFSPQYCNTKLKRYCDKNIFFNQYVFNRVNWKYIFLFIWEDFEMLIQYFDKKCLFYLFIAISFHLFSQYCVPKCLVWIRPKQCDPNRRWMSYTFSICKIKTSQYHTIKLGYNDQWSRL